MSSCSSMYGLGQVHVKLLLYGIRSCSYNTAYIRNEAELMSHLLCGVKKCTLHSH